ncbi:hypothetical protein ACXJY6_07680 [Vibrio sp. RC27]
MILCDKNYSVVLLAFLLSGCDDTDLVEAGTDYLSDNVETEFTADTEYTSEPIDTTESSITLEAFNLTDIIASSLDAKAITVSWTSASEELGVTYTVCKKDADHPENCNTLASVIDALTTTATVDSLAEALVADYFVLASAGGSSVLSSEDNLTSESITEMVGYFKASNSGANDYFGYKVALSGDGNTLAVSARDEENDEQGVTMGLGFTDTNTAGDSGAVYLFSQSNGSWEQTAYIKASNSDASDRFGESIALNLDGTILAVGAPLEDNVGATDSSSGAVYVFNYENDIWDEVAYLKASNLGSGDEFGNSIALNDSGNILAVGAYKEDSSQGGIDATYNEAAAESGAVYIFSDIGGTWGQTDYIKASAPIAGDNFGYSISLDSDGVTLAVGTYKYGADDAGAVYLFSDSDGSGWQQVDLLQASNAQGLDYFGNSVSLNGDGTLLAVGAYWEDNNFNSISSTIHFSDSSTINYSGAVYLFENSGGTWDQTTYIKASNVGSGDNFGNDVMLSRDGSTLAVGAYMEDNGGVGIINDVNISDDYYSQNAGAVYMFSNGISGWEQTAYIKASNTGSRDNFGNSLALSEDGNTLAVGAHQESNSVSEILTDGSEIISSNDDASKSGAVYLY